MKPNDNNRSRFFSQNVLYVVLTGIGSIPIFLFMLAVVKSVGFPEDEATTLAFTLVVIAGVYIGRFIARIWAFRLEKIRPRLFVSLSLLATGLLAWLFFYAEFPLRDRFALAILLFGLPLFAVSIIAGILIKLARAVAQKQIAEAKSMAAHSASELQLLQSQISPHFLFNTLNNMYGLSITQHEKIPQLLLKLSDLLRYSVYEANKQFVPLADEMAYINNYIEFEKMRIGDRLSLSTDFEDFTSGSAKVAPMMLIVFIENAFKHSRDTTDEKIYIHISAKSWSNRILFSVVNSYRPEERKKDEGSSGLGLENVKKRLELLYPMDHHLVIEDSENTYKVMLQIKMK
ncbi:MAG: histidine kinase [Chitinophagaceae bacterium]|nr:histidine kinase [Chitinophagaceae bacterium]